MGVDAWMFVRLNRKVTDVQIKQWSYQMCEAFGREWFWIEKEKDRHAIWEIEDLEEWYGLVARPGETVLNVDLTFRYYGPGYERGPFYLIYTLAIYLEKLLDGEVWYGGDSGGETLDIFDHDRRESYMEHFVKNGGRPYRQGFSLSSSPEIYLCGFCQGPYVTYSWGPFDARRAKCPGCHDEVEYRENDDDN